MNRNLLIAILAVVVILAAGLFVFTQSSSTTDGKLNTQINVLSESTLQAGEQVQFELKDAQGAALSGQNILIQYDDGSGNIQNYNIVTDQDGKGYLTLSGEDAGTYQITLNYNGTDKYNGCTAKFTLTIEDAGDDAEEPEETESNATANTVMYNNNTESGSANSYTSSQSYYDADLNVYYDVNGRVIGGQSDGANIYDLRNNPPQVDEEGNLV